MKRQTAPALTDLTVLRMAASSRDSEVMVQVSPEGVEAV
jgi:hypothetical protein